MSVCSSVAKIRDILEMREPILMHIGTSGRRGNGVKRSGGQGDIDHRNHSQVPNATANTSIRL